MPVHPRARGAQVQVERLAFTIPEVCEALGLSRQGVYNLLSRGELRSVTIGRSRRIPRTEVERLAGITSGGAA
ncbi:MAG: helix-turn-helix domain-containing protein [Myxococcales bacterium]|nr:helix-turn-helix domain-containing protein [Myxococcales bacterium]